MPPYSVTINVIPGIIEAENYDVGGQDVSYHDTTPGNTGGALRKDDVDIQTCTDGPQCYAVDYIEAGEWLQFSVQVAQTGMYQIDARYAFPNGTPIGAQRQISVKIDVDQSDAEEAYFSYAWYQITTMSYPPVVFLDNAFGASLQQLGLDADASFRGLISNCINYLANQVLKKDTPGSIWNLEFLSERGIIKITNGYTTDDLTFQTPNYAFNVLIIFLKNLPSPLIPLLNADCVLDPKLLAEPERAVVVALKDLIQKVQKSNITDKDKQFFETELEKALTQKWPQASLSLRKLANIFNGSGDHDPTLLQDSFLQNISLIREMRYQSIQLGASHTRQREFEAYMKTSLIKLEALKPLVLSLKRYVNEIHYHQFSKKLQELAATMNDQVKKKADKKLNKGLFDSRYLFIQIQHKLIEQQYHLDIYTHYVLKEAGVDWSTDEKIMTKFDDALVWYDIESQARRFWCNIVGFDKLIVHRKYFLKQFQKHCKGAGIFESEELDRILALLDPFETNFVTIFTFADLMRSFGNNTGLIKEALRHSSFLGNLDKEVAQLLDGQQAGSYLIRYDTRLVVNFVSGTEQRNLRDCDYKNVSRRELVVKPIGFDEVPTTALITDDRGEYNSLLDVWMSNYQEWLLPFTAFPTHVGFMGDLQASEVPVLPPLQYIIRFSSLPSHVTISWNNLADAKMYHTRIQIVGQKVRTNSKLYDNLTDFLSTFAHELKPFVQRHEVYQTEFDVIETVSDPFTLNDKLMNTNHQLKISKMKDITLGYFNLSDERKERLCNALLHHESLTSVTMVLPDEEDWQIKPFIGHSNLRELHVARYQGNSIWFESPQVVGMIDLILSLPKLEYLGLHNWPFVMSTILNENMKITTLKRLSVDLSRHEEETYKCLETLYTSHPSLTALTIDRFDRNTLPHLSKLPKLKQLTVRNPQEDIWEIQRSSDIFCSLEKLTLQFNNPKDSERRFRHKNLELNIMSFSKTAEFEFDCMLHFSPFDPIWRSAKTTSMYWALEGPTPIGSVLEAEKLQRIEHLRLRGGRDPQFLTTILGWFSGSSTLKSLAIDDCLINPQGLNALQNIKSLRALSLRLVVFGYDYLDVQSLLSQMPSLTWIYYDGVVLEKDIRPMFKRFPTTAIYLAKSTKNVVYKHYATMSYQRRQDLVTEMQDWIINIISIVRCSELFDILPVEIWEQIMHSFSFMKPFLDAVTAFRMIRDSESKVVKVVDWHNVKRLIEENAIIVDK